MPSMATSHGGVLYYVVKAPRYQEQQSYSFSVESGWENPFRPGGDLSREADEIVELIKGGKPITPTSGGPNRESSPPPTDDQQNHIANNVSATDGSSPDKKQLAPLHESTPKSANGSANKTDDKTVGSPPGSVDVKRATVKPDGDASQVEHITIKKKPKCKCCVIQ
ncbi:hypothetical protein WA026_013645 [Henosepilachna vigintioctopunctata]|uniref:Uncharacterized protein n=1 Tax=Henosepilachna vigintioctopunctata TaxID=420089 RepID=A0AAW1UTG8_9CUCU